MSTSGLVTILFTDLVDSTALASRLGDLAADELRRAHFDALRAALDATGGTEVKTIGDALMASYPAAADALAGAVAMQRNVAAHAAPGAETAVSMRVGISAGDATFEDGDWFGTPVVEAARLCELADSGQILVSEIVRALAGSRTEHVLRPVGTRTLRGRPDPISVCEVAWVDDSSAAPVASSDARSQPRPGRVDHRFGDCTLRVDRGELVRAGETVAVEPRALEILVQLVEAAGEVVSKHELLDAVWGDRFVSESALTTQIKELRRALGDDGRSQRVIKTVHGRGYVLAMPVETVARESEAPSSRANPLVAVMPFATLGPDDEGAHVAEGLTQDVVTALSKHRWLQVPSRTVTDRYRDESDALARLHRDLGVDYVVSGSVRVSANRLRVIVDLADAAARAHRWSERYDREFEDLFAVQDEITAMIAARVEPDVGLAERERAARGPRTDVRAWDCYHLGVAHFFRFTREDNREAQRLLAASRELDPGFGEAHAWWAYATVLGMVYWDTETNDGALDLAFAATTRAVEIDDQNAVFHAIKGRVQLARREYSSALVENQRAIELNPTFAAAYCGLGDSLCYEGRYDEAIAEFERAVALGTHDPQRWAFLTYGALAMIFAGQYESAVAWTELAETVPNCQYWTTAHLTVALAHLGRLAEARIAADRLVRDQPDFTCARAMEKLFYLKRPEQLERYVEGLRLAGVAET